MRCAQLLYEDGNLHLFLLNILRIKIYILKKLSHKFNKFKKQYFLPSTPGRLVHICPQSIGPCGCG